MSPDAEPGPAPAPVQSNRCDAHRPAPHHTPAVCNCPACQLADAADRAIALTEIVELGALLIVPDIVMIESVANGIDLPESPRFVRDDGRAVYAFRAPRVPG